ncbi:hypothetical protein X762_21225 [Mesorhizobium sp. LSHC426A00]|nr:hypothetical protein X762_21225 [Mesorhizobium sp. LSHC426A00]
MLKARGIMGRRTAGIQISSMLGSEPNIFCEARWRYQDQ